MPGELTDTITVSQIHSGGNWAGVSYLEANGKFQWQGGMTMDAWSCNFPALGPDGVKWSTGETALWAWVALSHMFAMQYNQPSPATLPPAQTNEGYAVLDWSGTPA